MNTELTFLIELLLNHDLQKVTKDLVATRIKEVELILTASPQKFSLSSPQTAPQGGVISHPEHIAQTPLAAKSLQDREAMIAAQLAGKAPMKNRQFR